jgi:type IV secretion system protein VirB4
MLDEVLCVPAELTLSQVFRLVEADSAKRVIKNVQRFHLNLQKSVFSYFREAMVGEESAVQDTGRAVSAADAREALTDMAAARRVFGYLNVTVLVHASNREQLEENLKQVARTTAPGLCLGGYLAWPMGRAGALAFCQQCQLG